MKTAQNIKVELNKDVESLMTTQTKIKLKMENVGYHTKLLVMSASFSLPQSSHSWEQMGSNRLNRTMFTEYRLGARALSDDFTSSKLRDLCRGGETGGASGMGDSKHTVSSRHSRTEAHTKTHRPWQHTRPAQVQARRVPSIKRGSGPWSYAQLIPTGKEKKKSVFSDGVSLGISTQLQGRPHNSSAFFLWTVLLCLVMFCLTGLLFVHFEVWWAFLFFEEKTKLDG